MSGVARGGRGSGRFPLGKCNINGACEFCLKFVSNKTSSFKFVTEHTQIRACGSKFYQLFGRPGPAGLTGIDAHAQL